MVAVPSHPLHVALNSYRVMQPGLGVRRHKSSAEQPPEPVLRWS